MHCLVLVLSEWSGLESPIQEISGGMIVSASQPVVKRPFPFQPPERVSGLWEDAKVPENNPRMTRGEHANSTQAEWSNICRENKSHHFINYQETARSEMVRR